MCASIKAGLGQNEGCGFVDHRVYFYKSTEMIVCQHEYAKGTSVTAKGFCHTGNNVT